MMKTTKSPLIICLIVLLLLACSVNKVTIKVVDEDGNPIEGARVGMGFEKNTGWATESSGRQGLTRSDGLFSATGSGNGHITYGARKEDYYDSYYDYDFKDGDPWNKELKIVMRKIENPVQMYIKNAAIKIPVIGEEVGFDLILYDWVTPYGIGKHRDFMFFLEKKYIDRDNFESNLTIKFSNIKDGIIKVLDDPENGSVFKLPKYAPKDGYNSIIKLERRQGLGKSRVRGYRQDDSYLFRCRSEIEGSKPHRSMYGKILGPIQFDRRTDPTEIYFKYYINPDYTRNLEHDPNSNLF